LFVWPEKGMKSGQGVPVHPTGSLVASGRFVVVVAQHRVIIKMYMLMPSISPALV